MESQGIFEKGIASLVARIAKAQAALKKLKDKDALAAARHAILNLEGELGELKAAKGKFLESNAKREEKQARFLKRQEAEREVLDLRNRCNDLAEKVRVIRERMGEAQNRVDSAMQRLEDFISKIPEEFVRPVADVEREKQEVLRLRSIIEHAMRERDALNQEHALLFYGKWQTCKLALENAAWRLGQLQEPGPPPDEHRLGGLSPIR